MSMKGHESELPLSVEPLTPSRNHHVIFRRDSLDSEWYITERDIFGHGKDYEEKVYGAQNGVMPETTEFEAGYISIGQEYYRETIFELGEIPDMVLEEVPLTRQKHGITDGRQHTKLFAVAR